MHRKTISMPDAMGEWISARVAAGQFNNESEYFRDLVRRDQEEMSRRAYLKARLIAGDDQIAAGQSQLLETDADINALFGEIDAESP